MPPNTVGTAKNMLLVEAQSDKDFIQRLIEHERKNNANFLLNTVVEVAIPTDFDETERTNKNAVLKRLPMLVRSLNDGLIERLGIIIDMDSEGKNPFAHNLKLIENSLNGEFTLKQSDFAQGLFFENDDFNPIGFWLMPNNQDEGYLETWIENCITDKDGSYFNTAKDFIDGFDHIQPAGITKAKVYTWLAIQDKPRNDLRQVLNKGLINTQAKNYQNFKQWLITTFAD